MRTISLQSRLAGAMALIVIGVLATAPASAQKKYDPGASDTEIKIGNTAPYSGFASSYGAIAKAEAAYFKMVNDKGGVNGRKITFISYDDALAPQKTVEHTRKLVESDEVLAIFSPVGSSTGVAVQKYLNSKKVPQLFVATGSSIFDDPRNFPWAMGFQPTYRSEAVIYAKYVLKNHPAAKVAVLMQNNDYGREYFSGLKEGLGDKAKSMIVADSAFESTDPTIDSQILKLRASGADLLVNTVSPKFAAMSIKKMAEIGWKPVHILPNISISVASVMKPAGLENGQGVISSGFLMDPTDAKWKDSEDMKTWRAFMDKYMPEGDRTDLNHVYGYVAAQVLVQVLSQCGDDLTRANVMKHATNLKNVKLPLLLPGIAVDTSPTSYGPVHQLQMMRFKGESWEVFGPVLNSAAGN